MEAVLWIARVDAPWRDLPARFGHWNSVSRHVRGWAQKGAFDRLFAAFSGDPDVECAMVDGTIARVPQHAMGAKGGVLVRRSNVCAAT